MENDAAGPRLDSDLVAWALLDLARGHEAFAAVAKELADGIRTGGLPADLQEVEAIQRLGRITCEWQQRVTLEVLTIACQPPEPKETP